jgi:hypothetical protein
MAKDYTDWIEAPKGKRKSGLVKPALVEGSS